ncbi:MAG: helix-turn-helix domain-containing protein [Erysipelotrichales bacterium]|nr:helix-turn-helix domain-containing protein [Erysipelotrichales bacterium]
MDIANKIVEIRKANNITQEELARKLFVTRQAVSRWENGDTMPSIEILQKITGLFKLDTNTSFGVAGTFFCQSCGSHYPTEGFNGSNKNGEASDDYCKYCLVDGSYGKPNETVEEMVEQGLPWRLKSDNNPDGYPDAETAREEMLMFYKTLKRWQ